MSKADQLDHLENLLGAGKQAQQPKVFARPFRVVFKKTEDQTITWLEIRTLAGLRKVCSMLADGNLVPIDAFATLDRQLWGHLAEYIGFLRHPGLDNEFSAGIQPVGSGFGELVDDLSPIFGGSDEVLSGLSTIRDQVMRDIEAQQPFQEMVDHTYVKEDGVNLTSEGENKLADILGEDPEVNTLETLVAESEPEEVPDDEETTDD